jgi:hypothetical protein
VLAFDHNKSKGLDITHDSAVPLSLPDLFTVQAEVVWPLVQRNSDD